jgi:hypothetical protein
LANWSRSTIAAVMLTASSDGSNAASSNNPFEMARFPGPNEGRLGSDLHVANSYT